MDENEKRYEEDDVQYLADFNVHNLVFCFDELKMSDPEVIAQVVNAMMDAISPFIGD